jgi:hypothetical protein
MCSCRPDIFRKRWFEPTIIVTCVRMYLRFPEPARRPGTHGRARLVRGSQVDLALDQAYAPQIYRRLQGEWKRGSGNLQLGTWTRLWYGSPAVGGSCSALSTAVAQPLICIGRKGGIAKLPKSFGNEHRRIRPPAAGRFRAGWAAQ